MMWYKVKPEDETNRLRFYGYVTTVNHLSISLGDIFYIWSVVLFS